MLIKIQTAHHADSFLLIDRVDSVRYETNPKQFSSHIELSNYLRLMAEIGSSRIELDPRTGKLLSDGAPDPDCIGPLSETRVYRLNTLAYVRDGHLHSVTFDTIAYICTDEGKTLERALAGGILNY